MRKIYFQKEHELMYCCDALFQSEKWINISWEQAGDLNHVLLIEDTVHPNTWIHCIVKVYTTYRLQEKITDIAKSVYFYHDALSLKKIYNKTIKILQDDYYVNAIFQNEQSLYKALFILFTEKLSNVKDIYFDALVTFSMRSFDEKLIQAVGYGIDEVKQDEVHEQFIAYANEFIRKCAIQTEKVYVLMKDEPILFQENGMIYPQQQLIAAMNKTPLYLLQLDEEERFLSPLIALAPKEIHLFTERPIEAGVYSLCQIFKEKVQIYSLDLFPFISKVK